MLRSATSSLCAFVGTLTASGRTFLLAAGVASGALVGCDKPAQGPEPAGAGAAPSTNGVSSPDDAPAQGDAAGVDESGGGAEGGGGAGAGGAGKADGASCLTASECASGVCEGEGCGDEQPGTCVPTARMCTRDLREYCGCDGVTFRASGSCPGARFSKREAC